MNSPSTTTWAVILIVALPVLVLTLSEAHMRLNRTGNSLARPVNRVRLWLLPMAALLVLLTQAAEVSTENSGVRVVATLVGIGAVTAALGGLNAVLFGNASPGTWRERLPSIFVDLARLVLVVAGAAVVASFVWGLDVGGLFAALGVGSIVIGLALQNAVGSVVSGLLLLFEQPFRIGDSLDVGGVRGRVVEMNWRSTHLDIGSGIQVVPNATLAAASFSNLSLPTTAHDLVVESRFTPSDPPHQVMATLDAVAHDVPNLRPGARPSVLMRGDGTYTTTIPLLSPADADDVTSLFQTWIWYAARREGLALGGQSFPAAKHDRVITDLRDVTSTLDLTDDDLEAMAQVAVIEAFGDGEHLVRIGQIPPRLGYVLSGTVLAVAETPDALLVNVAEYDRGETVGTSSILREPARVGLVARGTVEILWLPVSVIDRLVAARADVARRLNHLLATREEMRRQALAGAETLDV